jgi:putative Ca2+/H+ antiporter (TMEM165/GDT1 family)
LLVAVALLFAGIGGLIDRRPPGEAADWPGGAAVAAAIAVFVTEFGDKTQFLTAALAAQYDSLLLAAIGATLGATAALVPAVIVGERLTGLLPMKIMRRSLASILLLAGFLVAINALRLI